MATTRLLETKSLKVHFPVISGMMSRKTGSVRAVDDVSITVERDETLGLVGESGCGKTTLGRSVLRLIEPTSGGLLFEGQDLLKMSGSKLRGMRRKMQIIFQDPYSSLNPRMTVGRIIAEPLQIHSVCKGAELWDRVANLMVQVGLRPEQMKRYPHEFSGGQRQRVGIARAVALNPSFIVGDEPVSALDVSVQAQVLNLLTDLRDKYKMAYLFISHDLSVIRHMSDRVAVMYLGKIVEIAKSEEIFENPLHPYTKALLSSLPIPDPLSKRKAIILKGDLPSPANPPPGCPFHTRCPVAKDFCKHTVPELKESASGHKASCLLL